MPYRFAGFVSMRFIRIKDKNSKVIRFRANKAQREFFRGGHLRDIILKARQLGFTTFVMIFCLDSCLFEENYSAGCIAHNEKSAKSIFRSKVKFAYTHISKIWLQVFKTIDLKFPVPTNDRDNGYIFDNGSQYPYQYRLPWVTRFNTCMCLSSVKSAECTLIAPKRL